MSAELRTWKRIRSEEVANCRVFVVRRDLCVSENDDFENSEHTFYVLECPAWCNIIPITKDDEVVLIEQFRQGTEAPSLEIPGGIVDEDETPEEAAERELLEETGYAANEIIFLGKSHPNPAIQNNFVYHFAAFGCEKKQEPQFDSSEHCVERIVPLAEIDDLIMNEEITHSLVLAGFQRFNIYQNKKNL
ncbi:MAG: NUDIX hydrolase [Acidobacteriota bacterium]|nr:NUDIX hydrolase [Acidobacteriota bacterium]